MSEQLDRLPLVSRFHLSTIAPAPDHPRAGDGKITNYGYVVHHPDGPVVFDTGIGTDNAFITTRFQPQVTDIVDALNRCGVDERDVVGVINCHLHFDHCGQNSKLKGRPVYVQRAELEAAAQPGFTVPEWAAIPKRDRRVLDGDLLIGPGLLVAATPGHTPGHQSLVITSGEGTAIVAGQCGYCASEFEAGLFPKSEAHDDSDDWRRIGEASVQRLRALDPRHVFLAHDSTTAARTSATRR